MVNRCVSSGCYKYASYGLKGEIPTRCTQHKEDEMVDVSHESEQCKYHECKTRAIFGNIGERAQFCVDHKEEDMIDVYHDSCMVDNCYERGYYCFLNAKTNLYCFHHKKNGMIIPDHRHCIEKECNIRPSYGYEAQCPIACKDHKKEDMVDVVSSGYCERGSCKKRACYISLENKKRYCVSHKDQCCKTMEKRVCYTQECTARPSYGFHGMIATSCSMCAKPGMEDVVHPKCEHNDCKVRASYGPPGETREVIYCTEHAPNGWECKPNLKKCNQCENVGHFGFFKSKRAVKCEDHKEVGMFDVVTMTCAQKITSTKNSKNKKRRLSSFFETSELPKCEEYDDPELPDFVWLTPTHIVALEVDENQNKGKAQCDQESRMKKITTDIDKPMFWLRYNPDSFKGKWNRLTIKTRYEMLVETIKSALETPAQDKSGMCRVTYMFYDGCKRGNSFQVKNLEI